jgi:hypothetical protein
MPHPFGTALDLCKRLAEAALHLVLLLAGVANEREREREREIE